MSKPLLGYVIPPLSQHPSAMAEGGSTSRKRSRTEAGQGRRDGDDLQKERGRREKMGDLYTLLQNMVPTLFPKATKVKIVSETVEYIKELERRRARLEEMKKSMESVPVIARAGPMVFQCSNPDSSFTVTVSGNVVFFGIQSPRVGRGLATRIIMVFEKHQAQVFAANVAEVFAANVAVNNGFLTVTVTAFLGSNGESIINKIIRDIQNL